ncbi:DUF4430 domain-containing protein [Clostridium rectalis]|uniref:DUF4430 domain-containing protein n=1 Tax=Clostridium rectalis TaxID=2040295 RepID=UPI000F62E067|nr:DUF4430 domain-containing protein [Clostridium rectalis]
MKKFKKILPILILVIMSISIVGCKNKENSDKNLTKPTSIVSKNQQKNESKKESEKNSSVKKDNKSLKKRDKENKNKSTVNSKEKDIKKESSSKSVNVNKTKKVTASKALETKKDNKTFTLVVGKNIKGYTGKSQEIILKKRIDISENKSAMTYLRENLDLRDEGGFIYEINGVHNLYPIPMSQKTEQQKKLKIMGIDWFIYINGKKASVGANDLYPKSGDEILLDYHEWDKRELVKDSF